MTGRVLRGHHWPVGQATNLAKRIGRKMMEDGLDLEAVLARLEAVRRNPALFLHDHLLSELARECSQPAEGNEGFSGARRTLPLPYPIWGRENIDEASIAQMDTAMSLPVAVAGALMPDAHVGYGLPIGGVLATQDVVIPYAVGVDIACRMRLSIYQTSPGLMNQKKALLENALMEQTAFGVGSEWKGANRAQHAVLDDPAWRATPLLKGLHDNAVRQLGTSGSGNHFVEWGTFQLDEPTFGLSAGSYLALLSHSGSRSVGYQIADQYSKLAMRIHPELDRGARHLAWLDLVSQEGEEYWLSMELAGRFASANHEIIHRRVAAAVGLKEFVVIENHHNFAWKERLPDGRSVIVHRKGATPAGNGVLGVIPGSMADPGYLIRGKGLAQSLMSAAHGAGRALSRKAAKSTISRYMRDAYLKQQGVTLLGGGLDESPQAYKPIDHIISAQSDLLEVVGKFNPKIVRMAGEAGNF